MSRPTQADVAKRAGVSRATVSYVLNGLTDGRVPISGETRQPVLKAIDELGYAPDARAQALRSGNTNTVALMIPDLRNPHFLRIRHRGRGSRSSSQLSPPSFQYKCNRRHHSTLIMFMFFQRQIVSGMTSGAVKGKTSQVWNRIA